MCFRDVQEKGVGGDCIKRKDDVVACLTSCVSAGAAKMSGKSERQMFIFYSISSIHTTKTYVLSIMFEHNYLYITQLQYNSNNNNNNNN